MKAPLHDALGNALGSSIADQMSEAGAPPPASADEKAAILSMFEGGPGGDSTPSRDWFAGSSLRLGESGRGPRLGTGSIEPDPTPDELQAAFRQSERDYRSRTERSVAGSGYVARNGDSISRIVGSSDPQAIGNFMRANGLSSSTVEAGRNYFRPDEVTAFGDSVALGQAVLNNDNARLAALAQERFAFSDGRDARDIRESFAYQSRVSRELGDLQAQADYQAKLASGPQHYLEPTNVAAQQAAEVRRASLLNYLNGQGNMALGGVVAAGVMIGSRDVVVASQATDALEPVDSLMAPMGGGAASRLGRVRGSRPIDYGKVYEADVRGLYGEVPFQQRTYEAFVNGQWVNGVADNVAMLNGRNTAIEAKYVDNWATSLRNPASPEGNRPWAVAEQQKMIDQAVKYSRAFDQTLYHTNSVDLVNHYTPLFEQAGATNFKFVITPPITPKR